MTTVFAEAHDGFRGDGWVPGASKAPTSAPSRVLPLFRASWTNSIDQRGKMDQVGDGHGTTTVRDARATPKQPDTAASRPENTGLRRDGKGKTPGEAITPDPIMSLKRKAGSLLKPD